MYFFFRTTVAEAPPVENAVQYILYSVLAILCAVKVECVIYHTVYSMLVYNMGQHTPRASERELLFSLSTQVNLF